MAEGLTTLSNAERGFGFRSRPPSHLPVAVNVSTPPTFALSLQSRVEAVEA